MTPIEWKHSTIKIAETQDEYITLPAHIEKGGNGTVTTCWRASIRDRIRILFKGRVYLQLLTFNRPLQPLIMQTTDPLEEIAENET